MANSMLHHLFMSVYSTVTVPLSQSIMVCPALDTAWLYGLDAWVHECMHWGMDTGVKVHMKIILAN